MNVKPGDIAKIVADPVAGGANIGAMVLVLEPHSLGPNMFYTDTAGRRVDGDVWLCEALQPIRAIKTEPPWGAKNSVIVTTWPGRQVCWFDSMLRRVDPGELEEPRVEGVDVSA